MTLPAKQWRDTTRALLIERPRTLTYEEIAENTGLSVAWLRDFASGRRSNPGICHVEILYTFLKENA